MDINPQIEKYQIERLRENAERIATDLERLAERVRDEARDFERVSGHTPQRRYGNVVSSIQHAVLWGLANLNIDRLATIAADADVAAAGGFSDPEQEKKS